MFAAGAYRLLRGGCFALKLKGGENLEEKKKTKKKKKKFRIPLWDDIEIEIDEEDIPKVEELG